MAKKHIPSTESIAKYGKHHQLFHDFFWIDLIGPPTFLSAFSSANFLASATSPASFGSCHKSNCLGTHEKNKVTFVGFPQNYLASPGCPEVRILQIRISGLLENPKWW